MKAFLLNNTQIGLSDDLLETTNIYFYDFFIPTLLKNMNEIDKIFILGNLFNIKENISIKTLTFVINLFNKFKELNIKIFLICGKNEFKNIDFLKLIKNYDNVKIITETTVYKNICMIPYNNIKNNDYICDYIFSSTKIITNKKCFINSENNVIVDNYTYIGNPYHIDKNDKDNTNGIFIIDTITNTQSFIENNINKQFKSLIINDLSIIDKLLTKDTFKNNLSISINESILDIKYRHRLEELSLKKEISINIVNDIKIDEIIDDLECDEIDDLSTEEIIRRYVNNKVSKSLIKEKYLNILEDSIKISKK